jgi:hypothetical protein
MAAPPHIFWDPAGHLHTNALHWEGFPRLLWDPTGHLHTNALHWEGFPPNIFWDP